MCYRCFNCDSELSYNSTAWTDSVNEYNFCSEDCENSFFESQTFDSDGIYTTFSSL